MRIRSQKDNPHNAHVKAAIVAVQFSVMHSRSTTEKDDVLLARLRSGLHPSLKQYLHGLDPSQDPICPNCRLKEQDL